ncbi:hypothetical protein COHA_004353 [Chlorella ohadii]|uniref:Methyltransferase domain-containing protein n=1 Tax=Chlorella ohadii TaxID=2649997 RepID=A0AAD5DSY2_9CHLO|nr:hypothetical protein COHA_004353 [Chlorella ohadii]
MAALARCMPSATAALHVTPRKAFSSSSGGGASAAAAPAARPSSSGGRSAHVCRSYTDPEVYSIAFNFRKFDVEVAHLLAMHQKHCSGALQHFLEVACGPAQHAILLAKTAGCAATGLDISPSMLAYAAQQAQAAGAAGSLSLVEADMSKEGWAAQLAQPADLACILLGSLAHCLDNGAALRCFAELSKAVRPGGLLVLELPHPSDLWGGYCLEEEQFIEAWDAESEDKSKTVLVEWGREGDHFDLQEQILHRTVGLSCYHGDELVSSEVDVVPQRQFTLQEIDLLGRATGFEVVEVHGDFDASIGLDHEEAFRSVMVLRRLPAAQ